MTTPRSILFVCLLLLAACATSVPPPKIDLTGKDPQAAWARVLSTHVDAEGRIDFTGMAKASNDLDVFVTWLSQTDPQSHPELFPTPPERLAFLLNSYNALAMYNVLHAGVLPIDTVKFFYLRELQLGGRWLSLYNYENDVIRPLGEERVHFALNCMVRACPRLPQEPFRAETLDRQLDAAAREFFSKPLHVTIDDSARTVRFSQILEFYTGDFLAKAPSLIEYANRYRSTPIPADYKVSFTPNDWTLNQR